MCVTLTGLFRWLHRYGTKGPQKRKSNNNSNGKNNSNNNGKSFPLPPLPVWERG